MKKITTLATALLSLASISHAATITWGSAITISGDTDVSTTGSSVYALNLAASAGSFEVNGVTFTNVASLNGNFFSLSWAGRFRC